MTVGTGLTAYLKVGALVLGAFAAGGTLTYRMLPIKQAPIHAAEPAAIEAVSDRVTQLERAMRRRALEQRVRSAQLADQGSKSTSVSSSPATVPVLERRSPTASEEAASLEAMLQNETRDAVWAAAYEEAVRASITESFPDARISRIDCRTSMCSISMSHPDASSLRSFVRDIARVLPPFAAAHVREDAEASTTDLHVIRSGYPVPSVE